MTEYSEDLEALLRRMYNSLTASDPRGRGADNDEFLSDLEHAISTLKNRKECSLC